MRPELITQAHRLLPRDFMAAITLAQAEAKLAAYLAAEDKVLLGQVVEIDGQKLQRGDLVAIQNGVKLWQQRVGELTARAAGRGRARTVSPGW